MGLPWIRLDTQWAHNPKVLDLIGSKSHAALVTYICGLGYSGAQGTAGYIPSTALPFIHGTARHAQQLVAAGLWHEAVGGWEINDWDEYQQTGDDAIERSRKAKLSALARWHPDKYQEEIGGANRAVQ